jgi:hypothetical protein
MMQLPCCLSFRGIMTTAATFLITCSSFAQQQKIRNNPAYDNDLMQFGIVLGYNNATFRTVPVKNLQAIDTVYAITPAGSSGFNIQMTSRLRLSENLDLRLFSGLSFLQRNLDYSLILNGTQMPETVRKSVESIFVEFPVELKFKSNRINNYRMYVLGGFKSSIDLASRKADRKLKDRQPVKIERNDYGYEIGFGMDIYLSYTKLSPEIKMFNGLRNLIVKDEFVYSGTLEALYSKIFTFSIVFEG